MATDFPAGIASQTAQRPWPLPESPWLMTQSPRIDYASRRVETGAPKRRS
jgi:hypothetical protein